MPAPVGIQDNNWRTIDNGHDRYDRYNSERKLAPPTGYIDSRPQFLAPPQDRFGNPVVGRTFEGRRF